MKVSLKSIDQVIRETLSMYQVPEASIEILTGAIHYANRSGVSTHGIRHLPMYRDKIISGHLNPRDDVRAVMDSEALLILDANGTFGQVAAQHALNRGIEKAKQYGIAMVGVRNSNTFGAAGYYGHQAALQGIASLIFANAAPAIAPYGGHQAIFGTNPLCFAFPGTDSNDPIVLDMATTVAARSKVKMAAKSGERIPLDWAVGPDGKPTDDPNVALLGTLLPIAGYKGYGLSLFIDLFAGLMTGSAYAGAVRPLTDTKHDSRNGQLFIFIDTAKVMAAEELRERVDFFCRSVRECGEENAVMLPGEPGYRCMRQQEAHVTISPKEFEDVNRMATEIGIAARLEEVTDR